MFSLDYHLSKFIMTQELWVEFLELLGFPLDPQNQSKNKQLVHLLNRLVETNHPDAIVKLALWYQSGSRGLTEDKPRAARLFLRAANLGSPEAMFQLSLCFEMGLGVEEDDEKARFWCEKAKEAGHPFASSP
jgi:TPR repeat protein